MSKLASSFSTPETSNLYQGLLEPDSGCTDVVEQVVNAIHGDSTFLPQKYLYASLAGARLWKELCDGVPINTHIAEVYKRFPLGVSEVELAQVFRDRASSLFRSDGGEKRLGIIALGAGTGSREATICKWLVGQLELDAIEAVLVDVSSELLGESLKEFQRTCGERVHPKFAVLDFQSPRGHSQLRHLREHVLRDVPVILLLLGNTFGNIDQDTFVSQTADVMRKDDLLVCEFLLAQDEQCARPDGNAGGAWPVRDAGFDPAEDPRAQFMLNPLRTLGFNPKLSNLQRWRSSEEGRWSRDEYRYYFDSDERGIAPTISLVPDFRLAAKSWIGLLKIQAVTPDCCRSLFDESFGMVALVDHSYDLVSVSGRHVRMGYCFAWSPRAKSHVAVNVLDSRSSAESPRGLSFKASECEIEYDGTVCRFTPTQFALIQAMQNADASSKAFAIQEAAVEFLNEFLSAGGELNEKENGKLSNLREGVASHETTHISTLKADTKKSLESRTRDNPAAAHLLTIWPNQRQWTFRS